MLELINYFIHFNTIMSTEHKLDFQCFLSRRWTL